VYALGKRLAIMNGQTQTSAFVPLFEGADVQYNASGIVAYRIADWRGSKIIGSSPSQTYIQGADYAPFGELEWSVGSGQKVFAEISGDTLSDEYDALARKQHPAQGRWISPDPAGRTAVDPANPQTWNRYTYVANSPLSLTDPTGLGDPGGVPSCGDPQIRALCQAGMALSYLNNFATNWDALSTVTVTTKTLIGSTNNISELFTDPDTGETTIIPISADAVYTTTTTTYVRGSANAWGPAHAQQVMLQQLRPGGSMFKYYVEQTFNFKPPKGFCNTYKDAVRFDKDAAAVGGLLTGAELVAGQPELAVFTAKVSLVAGGSAAVTDLVGWGYCGQ
jgi:RHS repeat-associated protein